MRISIDMTVENQVHVSSAVCTTPSQVERLIDMLRAAKKKAWPTIANTKEKTK